MRLRARTDGNHREVMRAFRELGCTVADTSKLGSGFPDLVIGKHGINVLVEVKDGDKPPSRRRLTEDEQAFANNWKGWVETVTNIRDVVKLVRRLCRTQRRDTQSD